MTADEIYEEMKAHFEKRAPGLRQARKFSAGLLITFIDFLREIDALGEKFTSLDQLFETYEDVSANALSVKYNDKQVGIRGVWPRVASEIIGDHGRRDFPRSPGHATGRWKDYRHWVDGLLLLPKEDVMGLRTRTLDYILSKLEKHTFETDGIPVDPPMFRILLDQFKFGPQVGEPSGAAFQGVTFGFLRADAPHLQVETAKVRAGGKRERRVGDIDGWEGGKLVVSAEVKDFTFKAGHAKELEYFQGEVMARKAIGLVVAAEFKDGGREAVEELGLRPMSKEDLITVVSLWDPLKQRSAVRAFEYYAIHKEQCSALIKRLSKFIMDQTNPAKDGEGQEGGEGQAGKD